MPLAALLATKLYRVFQDVRLLLVPAFLVLLHMSMSCLLLWLKSALLVVVRDLLRYMNTSLTSFTAVLVRCYCCFACAY